VSKFSDVVINLQGNPKTWVITGVAGFIGSNLLEFLLKNNQIVVGLDNLSTGHRHNLDKVREILTKNQWKNFTFHEGNLQEINLCKKIVNGADHILHQAALGSVPRSIEDPISTNSSNIEGFLNILETSRLAGVQSFTYAASSSTYGDHKALPKKEDFIGNPLSPYAVTKYVNEIYADVYSRVYGFKAIGLRYFNVFGKRQDPDGAYAAVIPKWIDSMINNKDIFINGDGSTSRDFCYIENVIQMNILAATAELKNKNNIYNVAVGDRTNLNLLFTTIKENLAQYQTHYNKDPIYRDFRHGDVLHSQADISKAQSMLGYEPLYTFKDGMKKAISWYVNNSIK